MRIIDEEPGIEPLRQIGQRAKRREVAVHGKDAVGGDERVAVPAAMGRQQILGMACVVVAEDMHAPARKLRPGPQARMRELVDEDHVLDAAERRDDAGIGEVAGAEDAAPPRCP